MDGFCHSENTGIYAQNCFMDLGWAIAGSYSGNSRALRDHRLRILFLTDARAGDLLRYYSNGTSVFCAL